MKHFVGAVLSLLFIGAVFGVAFFYIGFYLSPQDDLAKSDAIVAISGGETGARAEEAIKLYKEGWAGTLIFSGAALDPNSPSNARAMATMALKSGVPPKDILLDELSADTFQNASGVGEIVERHQFKKIILVTSPYHQRRASLTFSAEMGDDVTILNHSAIDQTWRRSRWWDSKASLDLTLSELQKTLFVLVRGSG